MIYSFDVQKFIDNAAYYKKCFDEIESHLYPTGRDIDFDCSSSEYYEISRILAFFEQYKLNIIFDYDTDLSLLGVDSILLSLKQEDEDLYILLVDQKFKIAESCPEVEKIRSRITIVGHEFAHYIATCFGKEKSLAIPVTSWGNYIFANDPLEPIDVDLRDEEKIDLWYLSIMFGPRDVFCENIRKAVNKECFVVENETCEKLCSLMTKYTIIPTEFIYYLYVGGFIDAQYHFLTCNIDATFKYTYHYIPDVYPDADRNILKNCYQMMNNSNTALGKVVANYFDWKKERTVCFSSVLNSSFVCFAQYYAFAYIKGLPHFVFCVGTIQQGGKV